MHLTNLHRHQAPNRANRTADSWITCPKLRVWRREPGPQLSGENHKSAEARPGLCVPGVTFNAADRHRSFSAALRDDLRDD